MLKILAEYRGALIFLAKYLGLYIGLNTLYAFYIDHYLPGPDPATVAVTRQVGYILQAFSFEEIALVVDEASQSIPIFRNGQPVVSVFEGCNSINVMIVFAAFLVAFSGPPRRMMAYLLAGLVTIYLINLVRVILLYDVALYIPHQLYFFHKFFFTGIIYAVVFLWWYFWVNDVKRWKLRYSRSNG